MTFLDMAILSMVEGVTEFLPVSSTGHLILTSRLLHIQQSEFLKTYEIAIQSGAILSVVFLYWKTIREHAKLWKKITLAFLPSALIGFALYKIIKDYFLGNEYITLASLIVGGILFIGIELLHKEKDKHSQTMEEISTRQAIFIGLFQSVAVIPGVSRSGATILGAMLLGVKRMPAVEFSFLLAVPTMFAATGLDLIKTDLSFSFNETTLLISGFFLSFICAAISIKWLVKFVKTNSFIPFGVYRIVIGILFLLFVVRP